MRAVRRITQADRKAAKKRRLEEGERIFMNWAARVGEDVALAFMQAVRDNSEEPLMQLPSDKRENALMNWRRPKPMCQVLLFQPRQPAAP
jgi:hypothetical protein